VTTYAAQSTSIPRRRLGVIAPFAAALTASDGGGGVPDVGIRPDLGRSAVELYTPSPHRMCDVLDSLFADIFADQGELISNLFVDGAGVTFAGICGSNFTYLTSPLRGER